MMPRSFRGRRGRPAIRYVDYGSELRDSAAVLSFAAANPGNQARLTAVIDRIAERFSRAARTSTQEQAWLLMAAEAAVKAGGGAMTVATDGGAPQTRARAPLSAPASRLRRGRPTAITNRGDTPAWRSVSITGVPAADLPAESKGYTVSRSVFRPDGTAADLGKARQTDLFVVVIKGTRTDASQPAQTLVVDLLPAGFEIETATVSKGRSTTDYSWLPELTDATYTEQRRRAPRHRADRRRARRERLRDGDHSGDHREAARAGRSASSRTSTRRRR